MAAGHQVRDGALPSGRAAPTVPPPASRTASGQAVAPPPSRTASGEAAATARLLLLSAGREDSGAGAAAFGAAGAGSGQRSPVTRDSRLASSAVAVPVSAAAVTGRPDSAAAHAPAVHQEAYSGRTVPGWSCSSIAADVP